MSIAITGTPGVGKHTLAKKLSIKLNYEIIDINKIALKYNIYKVNIHGSTFDVDTSLLKKKFTKKSFHNSIIVGHLAPHVISHNQINKIIVIRRNPYELITTYKKRNYNLKKTLNNIGAEILGTITYDVMIKFEMGKICQFVMTNKIDHTVNKCIKCINNVGFENVDWLSLIAKNNDFKKFFDYTSHV
ncbi:MAG: AAA family ATPase [Thaumarchaeota archaeon]|nr:AAA family ATPase [Nitrososphaerota archaeon]MCY3976131.1 AAA family ATPase [Nitrososphaerota archaeon]